MKDPRPPWIAMRQALGAEEGRACVASIEARFRGAVLPARARFLEPPRVALYRAGGRGILAGEPVLAGWEQWLAEAGARVAYPRVEASTGPLRFHEARWEAREDWVPGAFGLLEPAPSRPEIARAELDLVIVPGVAFSRAGHRLGTGRGYYDRTLPLCVNALFVGLAYPFQLVDSLPVNARDVPMHWVLSPDEEARPDARRVESWLGRFRP